MDSFGDLFGAIGEAIGGAVEAREAFGGRERERDGYISQTETYDRTLAGAKRELNVNDV